MRKFLYGAIYGAECGDVDLEPKQEFNRKLSKKIEKKKMGKKRIGKNRLEMKEKKNAKK